MKFLRLIFFLKPQAETVYCIKTCNNMKKTILLLGLSVLSLLSFSQDPEFTQFYNNPLYTNPATAGMNNCGGKAMLDYRNQWPTLPGSFITSTLSADQSIDKIHGAIGLNILRDVAGQGLLTTTGLSVIYSYVKEFENELKLNIGIEPQYRERKIDFTQLQFADQIQANRGFVLPTHEPLISDPVRFFNFNTGVYLSNESFNFGVAIHNLLEPVLSFYGDTESVLPRRFTIHSAYKIDFGTALNGDHFLQPSALYMQQNKFTQLNFTLKYQLGPIVTGLGIRQTFGEFRNTDAALFLLGAKLKNIQFTYSIDATVSDARTAAPSSHEISLIVKWCQD
jgi:type IX secretion system PorP/SprF family membrane protein